MTTEDLVQRYMSDTKAVRLLFESGKIDRYALDSAVENLDNKLFGEFGFMPTVEVVQVVEGRDLDNIIDDITAIGRES